MRYDELRWAFNGDDGISPHDTSQRLRPIHINGQPLKWLPRVYVKKWDDNRFTIISVHPQASPHTSYERNLDVADVAVRLLRLMEDERVHEMLTIVDQIV